MEWRSPSCCSCWIELDQGIPYSTIALFLQASYELPSSFLVYEVSCDASQKLSTGCGYPKTALTMLIERVCDARTIFGTPLLLCSSPVALSSRSMLNARNGKHLDERLWIPSTWRIRTSHCQENSPWTRVLDVSTNCQ